MNTFKSDVILRRNNCRYILWDLREEEEKRNHSEVLYNCCSIESFISNDKMANYYLFDSCREQKDYFILKRIL